MALSAARSSAQLAGQIRIEVVIAVELAAELDRARPSSASVSVSVPSSWLRTLSVPADRLMLDAPLADQRRDRAVGDDLAGVEPARRDGDVAVDPAGGGQDDVEHLALARIFGAVEVARADLDRESRGWPGIRARVVSSVSALELGRAPLMTTLPAAPAKPRVSVIAEIEREAGHLPGDVERGARRILGEEGRFIDGGAGGLGRRGRDRGIALLGDGRGGEARPKVRNRA